MKNRLLFLFILFLSISQFCQAQKFYTDKGEVHFLSKAVLENIEAKNESAICLIDISTGDLAFKIDIKAFKFEKSLMEEHFNENYLESDKFPNATFSGKIDDFDKLDLSIDGKHEVQVSGDLKIHGVTKSTIESGFVEFKDGEVILTSDFIVLLKDYNIKIPKIVFQNVATKININLKATLQLYGS